MRIGIFSECYHPILNGVVVSIDTFKIELEKRGHQVFIFATGNRNSEQDPLDVFRYPAIPFPKDYPLAFPRLAPRQNRHFRDLKLDLIHTQHMFAMGKLGLRVARRYHLPLVHTYHTLITEYAHYVPLPQSLTRPIILRWSRSYCNKCDQLVTPSPAMKKILRTYGITVPIEAIPTGVYLEDFTKPFHHSVLKAKWGIPEHRKILLYVSRIAPEKNLTFLFEAIRLLAQKRDDFHLLLVGGGRELPYYQRLVEEWDLGGRVTFTGMQEKKITNRFFGAADIFVFPSITETQGIVITEAMAAGVPAVAVDRMGPSTLIKNGEDGFLVPLKIQAFSDKIELLLESDKMRHTFGQNAQKNAKKFSAENTAIEMEALYERTLDSYHSRS